MCAAFAAVISTCRPAATGSVGSSSGSLSTGAPAATAGSTDGDALGDALGLPLGLNDGDPLGLNDGDALGEVLGFSVTAAATTTGEWLGELLGDALGLRLGERDGDPLGERDGDPLGDRDGDTDGATVSPAPMVNVPIDVDKLSPSLPVSRTQPMAYHALPSFASSTVGASFGSYSVLPAAHVYAWTAHVPHPAVVPPSLR